MTEDESLSEIKRLLHEHGLEVEHNAAGYLVRQGIDEVQLADWPGSATADLAKLKAFIREHFKAL